MWRAESVDFLRRPRQCTRGSRGRRGRPGELEVREQWKGRGVGVAQGPLVCRRGGGRDVGGVREIGTARRGRRRPFANNGAARGASSQEVGRAVPALLPTTPTAIYTFFGDKLRAEYGGGSDLGDRVRGKTRHQVPFLRARETPAAAAVPSSPQDTGVKGSPRERQTHPLRTPSAARGRARDCWAWAQTPSLRTKFLSSYIYGEQLGYLCLCRSLCQFFLAPSAMLRGTCAWRFVQVLLILAVCLPLSMCLCSRVPMCLFYLLGSACP